MRIRKITIGGFGNFRLPVSVEFQDGLTCITGNVGSGKTTIMEAFSLALYGKTPAYTGTNVHGHIRGGDTEGEVTVEFEANGCEYVAWRRAKITDKGKTHDAKLWKAGQVVASGVEQVKRCIIREVGDYDLFLATIMQGQTSAGDLLYGEPPSDMPLEAYRRKTIGNLIETSWMIALSEKFLARAGALGAEAEILETQAVGGESLPDQLSQAETDLDEKQTALETATQILGEKRKAVDDARQAIRQATEGEGELKAAIERHQQAVTAHGVAERALTTARDERDRIKIEANGLDAARVKVAELDRLKLERTYLVDCDAAYRVHSEWKCRLGTLEADVDRRDSYRRQIVAEAKTSDEDVELAGKYYGLLDQHNDCGKANYEADEFNSKRQRSIRDIEDRLRDACGRLERTKARIAQSPKVPGDKDVCETCPLMKEFSGLPSDAESTERCIARGTELLEKAKAEPEKTIVDLSELVAQIGLARAANSRVVKARERSGEIEAATKLVDTASGLLNAHKANPVPEAEDVAESLTTARREIEELSGADERLKTAIAATDRLADAGKRCLHLEGAASVAKSAADDLKAPSDDARRTLENKNKSQGEIRARLAEDEKAVGVLETNAGALTRIIGQLESTIKHTRERIAEYAQKADDAKKLRAREAANRVLRQAFGPKGLPAILIDTEAAPFLEEVADRIFQTASGGAMSLRIATLGLDSKGQRTETFDVLISDSSKGRDFAEASIYSGGERSAIRFVFRIALLLFAMQRTGRDLSMLLLDEPMDGMNDAWRNALLQTIREYLPQFNQIIVVTHDQHFAADADNKITVSPNPMGAAISQTSRGTAVMEKVTT